MSAFFILAGIVIWGMFAATGLWLLAFFPALGKFSPAGWMPILCTGFVLAGLSLTRSHFNLFTGILYYAAYILFGLAFIAFCVTAGCAFLCIVLKLCHIPARAYLGTASLLLTGIFFACAVWGGFSTPKIKKISVQIPGMPHVKLAVLSDTHLGMGVSLARFDNVMRRIETQQPDALLVLGDIFEYGPNRMQYATRLAAFRPALGTYGVLGNHEYYVGYENSKDFFKQAGITLLENQTAVLPNGVQLAGLKDIKTAGVSAAQVTQLVDSLNPQQPVILLSHTPLYAEEAAAHGADLMLSGHTHNGQLWPFNYLVRLQFPRVYGLFDVNGMKFYITSGVFYWGIPLRLFAPAEIPIIEVN